MARKPAHDPATARSSRGPADDRRAPTLSSLRTEIDRIDRELVGLLNRRAEIAAQIGQVKERDGTEVWSPAREDEVVARPCPPARAPCPPKPSD